MDYYCGITTNTWTGYYTELCLSEAKACQFIKLCMDNQVPFEINYPN